MSDKLDKAQRLTAIETVVATYEAALLRYVTRMVFDASLAQDVVQETFLRLLRKWKDELAPSPPLSSWLYRVAHNLAIDGLRKTQRRQQAQQRHFDEQDTLVDPDRGQGFRISEDAARAAAALQELPVRERELVVLKVYEEKTYREISEITGLTTGNIGFILHHAMKRMARILRAPAAPGRGQDKADDHE